MPMTDDELRAWRAGLEGVTPGPWHQYPDDRNAQAVIGGEHIELFTCWHHSVGAIEKEMKANAAHIARCDPQTIATLIDEVLAGREGFAMHDLMTKEQGDRLRSENAALREALKPFAEAGREYIKMLPNTGNHRMVELSFELGDVRRARAALGKEG